MGTMIQLVRPEVRDYRARSYRANDGERFARRMRRFLRWTGSDIRHHKSSMHGELMICAFNHQKLQKKFPSPDSLRLAMEQAADKMFAVPGKIKFSVVTRKELTFVDGEWGVDSDHSSILVDMYAESWPFRPSSER